MVNIRQFQKFAAVIAVALVLPKGVGARTIEFPEEELASESVLPVFDEPVTVKNRQVVTKGRFEIGPVGGYLLTEPFWSPLNLGATASYHLTEDHGINLLGLYYIGEPSNYSRQLNALPNSQDPMNLQHAPAPKYLGMASYQYSAFYGKMSLTKNYVMNLHLYGLAGAGMIGIGDGSYPLVTAGLGQKFYFTKNWALRFDWRFYFYQGPDVLSRNLSTVSESQSASSFDEKLHIGSIINIAAIFLFPGL